MKMGGGVLGGGGGGAVNCGGGGAVNGGGGGGGVSGVVEPPVIAETFALGDGVEPGTETSGGIEIGEDSVEAAGVGRTSFGVEVSAGCGEGGTAAPCGKFSSISGRNLIHPAKPGKPELEKTALATLVKCKVPLRMNCLTTNAKKAKRNNLVSLPPSRPSRDVFHVTRNRKNSARKIDSEN
jgi:hypothetical protein